MTTIGEAWRFGQAALHDSPAPKLDARLLLEFVTGRDHAYLVAHDDEPLAGEVFTRFCHLVERAVAHEPIPYLTSRAPFFDLELAVSPAVLIPRPETEQLVELAVQWARPLDMVRAVDVGAGSGCIAISLARMLPEAQIAAVDISAEALAVAATNVECHAPDRVALVQGDLLQPFAPGFDLILANLPYIAESEWTALPVGVKSYEPALALHGGVDGLDVIRRLLTQAGRNLRPGGRMLLEIGWRQGKAAEALAQDAFPGAKVTVWPDFAGHDRIVVIQT